MHVQSYTFLPRIVILINPFPLDMERHSPKATCMMVTCLEIGLVACAVPALSVVYSAAHQVHCLAETPATKNALQFYIKKVCF